MGEPAPPRLREAGAPADDGGHLPADPYDLRDLPVRLDGDLDAARVPDLDPLLDHERRARQEPLRRPGGRARRRAPPRPPAAPAPPAGPRRGTGGGPGGTSSPSRRAGGTPPSARCPAPGSGGPSRGPRPTSASRRARAPPGS